MPEPTVQVQFPSRPLWADLLMMGLSLAAMAGLMLMVTPQHERQMLLLVFREKRAAAYRGLSARAGLAGRAGMSDELAGRNPRVRYEQARALAWWRDKVKP
jgi:hypothetical protein